MADEGPSTDQKEPSSGDAPSPVPPERNEKEDTTVSDRGRPKAATQNAHSALKSWRIRETLNQFWGFAKRPESTNVAMAIATIVIAIATVFTWVEIRSGSSDTKALADRMKEQADQTKIIASQAIVQANAASEAASVARDALISVQRAFVSFGQNLLLETIADNSDRPKIATFDFRPLLENSGTTPTRNLRHHFNFLWIPSALPDGFDFPDMSNDPSVPFLLGPKATMSGALMHVPTSTLLLVRDKGFHLYFWGWAMYQDVFKKTPVHVTLFCTEFTNFQGDPTRPTPTGAVPIHANYISCPHHNCHDEECDGEKGDPRKKYPQLIQPN
jgi:hypothetical protein